jgi:hypothetical protein
MINRRFFFLTIPILLFALFLRLYHISQQSFWFDEAFAWHIVIQPDMFPRIAADTHPPLFYLLLRGWMTIMGDSELALRSLSAFISTVTVAVMFPLGREIAKKLGMGLVFIPITAMLFFALNDADIFHAQEARNYALYNLLGASSVWLYLRWTRTQSRAVWLMWSGCIALLVYTHYQGVFIPALIGLHALLFLRGKTRLWAFGGLILAGITLAPWMILVTLPQAQNALEKGLPFAIPSNIETLLDLRHRFLGDMWVLVLGLMALGAWGFIQRKKMGIGVLVTGWVIIPFGVLFAGNLIAPLLTDRKLLLITPALCLLMAIGVHQLERVGRGLVIIAIVVYSLATVDFYHQRELWRDIADSALTYAHPQDLFLAEAEVGQYPLKYYLSRQIPAESAFYTFTFLGDPTMSPTLDWYTYYDLFLPDVLNRATENQADGIATAWVIFWSNDNAVLTRLENAGYTRTWTQTTDHIGNSIATYRYDRFLAPPVDTFANGMVLQGAIFDKADLRLDLWWQTTSPQGVDYTTAGGLLNEAGVLVAQWDSFPPMMTSQWGLSDSVYDPKPLKVVDGQTITAGNYTVIVKVYVWDGSITDIRTTSDEPYVTVGRIRLDEP